MMRQPLEDGSLTISRAAASLTYPARCALVAANRPPEPVLNAAMQKGQ
jgi:magnesium chelatase family protein